MPSQAELLRLVLNRLVPRGGDYPAAADLGIVDELERAAARSPATRRMLIEAVRQIDILASRRRPGSFVALSEEARDDVLREVEQAHSEFFEALLRHTYSAYYSHPRVVRLLGIEGPPQPHGYSMEPLEPDLVENVRRRPPIYRRP
jgi:hypothetical protein